jgi:glutathione S-transferase
MALHVAGVEVEHREVVLARKPEAMLQLSPKGEVPVLVLPDGRVLDQSLSIMHWALEQSDPSRWRLSAAERAPGEALIAQNDGPFKRHLDRTKYGSRFPGEDTAAHRAKAEAILSEWDQRLADGYLLGTRFTLVDAALGPFVRQFRGADSERFDGLPLPQLQSWLDSFLSHASFTGVMQKHPEWAARA